MTAKTKLELTWIGKENGARLEPRILLEDEQFSYHATTRRDGDNFDNILLKGDNLLGLKAIVNQYMGKIQCVYLDPPYNTGSAFSTYYDDGLEHSVWLSMMRERLIIISDLLSIDGHIFVQADDNEGHYLKVLMDEVFGRRNFIATFLWRKVDSPNDNKVPVTPDHEFIFCYSKDRSQSRLNQKPDPELVKAYGQVDNDGRRFRDRLLKKNGKNSLREDRPSMFFAVPNPDGGETWPIHDDGREARWALGQTAVTQLLEQDLIVWKRRIGFSGEAWVPYTREWAPASPTRPYPSIWSDLHTTRQAKAHQKEIFGADKVFPTPKPEDLIQRILELSTKEGDLVLDSFAGSGTTGAVAQKMRRKWIMIELEDHCETHIVPRLKQVIDGIDEGGITDSVGWTGGGGYRYFRLAPSLLEKDQFGQWVVSKSYNAAMLAEAMCKHFGFNYQPSPDHYWMQGSASESDFIYVTTASLTHDQLRTISDEVGDERTLLVCCKAFQSPNVDNFKNLTVRKIPGAVLDRCEWGKDDYSLKIENLPMMQEDDEEDVPASGATSVDSRQTGLFDHESAK